MMHFYPDSKAISQITDTLNVLACTSGRVRSPLMHALIEPILNTSSVHYCINA